MINVEVFPLDPENLRGSKIRMEKALRLYAARGFLPLTTTHLPADDSPGAILCVLAETSAMGLTNDEDDDEIELEEGEPDSGGNGEDDEAGDDSGDHGVNAELSADDIANMAAEQGMGVPEILGNKSSVS